MISHAAVIHFSWIVLLFHAFANAQTCDVLADNTWPVYYFSMNQSSSARKSVISQDHLMEHKECPDGQPPTTRECCDPFETNSSSHKMCMPSSYCYVSENQDTVRSGCGHCCPRPIALDLLCPAGSKAYNDGKFCCNCTGTKTIKAGNCPDGYVCTNTQVGIQYSVCCPSSIQETAVGQCRGLNGRFNFDNGNYSKDATYPQYGSASVRSITSGTCCRNLNETKPFGMIVSSQLLHTDQHWLCTTVPSNIMRANSDIFNRILQNTIDISPSSPAYVIEPNSIRGKHPGFTFDIDPLFDSRSKWIWLANASSASLKSHKNKDDSDLECVICYFNSTNPTLAYEVDLLRDLLDEYYVANHSNALKIFGAGSMTFEVKFDVYLELLRDACQLLHIQFGPCSKVAKDGKMEDGIISIRLDTFSNRISLESCNDVGTNCAILGPSASVAYGLHCLRYHTFTFTYKRPNQLTILNGAGDQLLQWNNPLPMNCTTFTHMSLLGDDGLKVSKLRIFRSRTENKCMFTEDEMSGLLPCGDGFITDENLCVKTCGCCFHYNLYDGVSHCYMPRGLKTTKSSSTPPCLRNFTDVVIGKSPLLRVHPIDPLYIGQEVNVELYLNELIPGTYVRMKIDRFGIFENVSSVYDNHKFRYHASATVLDSGDAFEIVAEIISQRSPNDKYAMRRNFIVNPAENYFKPHVFWYCTGPLSVMFEVSAQRWATYTFMTLDTNDDRKIDVSEIIVVNNLTSIDGTRHKHKSSKSGQRDKRSLGPYAHTYSRHNIYNISFTMQSLNKSTYFILQMPLDTKTCSDRIVTSSQNIVFQSGFSNSYTIGNTVDLRASINDTMLPDDPNLLIHWVCTTNRSWNLNSHITPVLSTPPESDSCLVTGLLLNNYARMDTTTRTSALTLNSLSFNMTKTTAPFTYYFHLLVSRPGYQSVASRHSQSISIIAGAAPEIVIKCRGNCGRMFNPNEMLVLVAQCLTCSTSTGGEMLTFDWDIWFTSDPSNSSSSPLRLRRSIDYDEDSEYYFRNTVGGIDGTVAMNWSAFVDSDPSDSFFALKEGALLSVEHAAGVQITLTAMSKDGQSAMKSYDISSSWLQRTNEFSQYSWPGYIDESSSADLQYLLFLFIPVTIVLSIVGSLLIIRHYRRSVRPNNVETQNVPIAAVRSNNAPVRQQSEISALGGTPRPTSRSRVQPTVPEDNILLSDVNQSAAEPQAPVQDVLPKAASEPAAPELMPPISPPTTSQNSIEKTGSKEHIEQKQLVVETQYEPESTTEPALDPEPTTEPQDQSLQEASTEQYA